MIMGRPRLFLMLVLLVLGACYEGAVAPDGTALLFQITASEGMSLSADEVTIHLQGPTPRTRVARPGETVEFADLEPGSYTVAIEGNAVGGCRMVLRDQGGVAVRSDRHPRGRTDGIWTSRAVP